MCLVLSLADLVMFRGHAEEALRFLRTHAGAARVIREADSALLATAVPYSTTVLWSMDTPAGRPVMS